MKKIPIWLIIILFLFPIGMITMGFIMLKDFLQDIPTWGIICFSLLFFLPSLAFFLSYRKAQNSSLKKNQKSMVGGAIFYSIFLLISIIKDISDIQKGHSSFVECFISYSLFILIIAIFLYAYFLMGKKQKSAEDNKLSEKE